MCWQCEALEPMPALHALLQLMQGPPAADTTHCSLTTTPTAIGTTPAMTCGLHDRQKLSSHCGVRPEPIAETQRGSLIQWRGVSPGRCRMFRELGAHAWLSHLVTEPTWLGNTCAVHRKGWGRRVQRERKLKFVKEEMCLLGPCIHYGACRAHLRSCFTIVVIVNDSCETSQGCKQLMSWQNKLQWLSAV